MTTVFFDGGDGKVEVKVLTIIQREGYLSYKIVTDAGIEYHSPLYKEVR